MSAQDSWDGILDKGGKVVWKGRPDAAPTLRIGGGAEVFRMMRDIQEGQKA